MQAECGGAWQGAGQASRDGMETSDAISPHAPGGGVRRLEDDGDAALAVGGEGSGLDDVQPQVAVAVDALV